MFYEKFISLCNKKGISPSRAALDMGLSKSTVTVWKKSGSCPSGSTLQLLADYFGVSVDYLIGNEDIKKDQPDSQSVKLSNKDIQEVKSKAAQIKDMMMASIGLAFDGEIEDEETLEKVTAVIEESMLLAKQEAKQKYTPKKYRK